MALLTQVVFIAIIFCDLDYDTEPYAGFFFMKTYTTEKVHLQLFKVFQFYLLCSFQFCNIHGEIQNLFFYFLIAIESYNVILTHPVSQVIFEPWFSMFVFTNRGHTVVV